MSTRKEYVNVGLPRDLVKEIDDLIQKGSLGYKSRGEFVKEAVRGLLKELMHLKKK